MGKQKSTPKNVGGQRVSPGYEVGPGGKKIPGVVGRWVKGVKGHDPDEPVFIVKRRSKEAAKATGKGMHPWRKKKSMKERIEDLANLLGEAESLGNEVPELDSELWDDEDAE